jgi:regulator of telomere elongation helicase 1
VLVNCLKRAFGSGTHLLALARAKSYRVHVTKMIGGTNAAGGGGFAGGRTISFWCFTPALAMRELSFLNVRSIIITSGTLSPLPSCAMELGLKFPVQLENDHVIMPDQIFVRVIGKGVSGKELSSKFGRRDDPEYITELGNTLASLCGNIPGGMLVFFPSYVAMEAAIQRWGGPASSSEQRYGGRKSIGGGGRGAAFFAAAARKKQASAKFVFPMVPAQFRSTAADQSSPWQRLLARKAIVLEPRSTSELSDAISEYKRFIAMPKSSGAILMGVCRGKISEGVSLASIGIFPNHRQSEICVSFPLTTHVCLFQIDFSDDMCRAVIVTGLPFPPYLDPKVKLKREFLDSARASAKSRPSVDGGFGNGKLSVKVETPAANVTLSGAEWYNQQAHRACNQAIGRVIRHRHDYGAVLLLDHRFAEVRNRDGLSKWLVSMNMNLIVALVVKC